MTSVLLVDDHAVVTEGLEVLLGHLGEAAFLSPPFEHNGGHAKTHTAREVRGLSR